VAEPWTAEQHAAIRETRHLLLAANAGTGKTSTVVGKILWRLGFDIGEAEDGPILPCAEPCELSQIAAITFTEKAAGDLRKKLAAALAEHGAGPGEIDRAFVGTIHSFCGEILRQHALRLDIDPSFRVMDAREASLRLGDLVRDTVLAALQASEPDVMELLKDAPLDSYGAYGRSVTELVRRAIDDLRWHNDRFSAWFAAPGPEEKRDRELDPEVLQSLVSTATGVGVEGGTDRDSGESESRHLSHTVAVYRLAYRALGSWLSLLERENRRDFDSLILDVRRLLSHERFAPALDALRRKYRLLIVDEFQDTDRAQRDIALAIAGLEGHAPGPGDETRLFLVGDPKQSIYGFRNADIRVWNEVESRLRANGAVLRLGRNFRSDPLIVRVVNDSCGPAFTAAGEALSEADPAAVVRYDPLDPAVEAQPGSGVDWLAPPADLGKDERSARGAALLADRIARLLRDGSGAPLRGSDERGRRFGPGDIAVLAARAATLATVESALRERGIPTFNASSRGLAERQEVMDAINALRLADNPRDDLRAFAWFRSPFVGLRDEVIARIRLDRSISGRTLLERARAWLDGIERGELTEFDAPEHPLIAPTERFALRRGLAAMADVRQLVGRAEPAELLETMLSRTSYRLHLQLGPERREAEANLDRLQMILSRFRFLTLADFLDAWDRAAMDRRSDLETATLPAGAEGAVFLSTIHGAKGLEWPVVAIAGAEDGARNSAPGRWEGWLDRDLGPILLPPSAERGPRTQNATRKRVLEETSESVRLLYVALTRARQRLLIAAPFEKPEGHAAWLAKALFEGDAGPDGPPAGRVGSQDAQPAATTRVPETDDPGTGTGRQLDAFGLHEPASDEVGQLNLLNAANHGPEIRSGGQGAGPAGPGQVSIWRQLDPIQTEFAEEPLRLEWLACPTEGPDRADVPEIPRTAAVLRSATQLALETRDPEAWRLKYVHGVTPASAFVAARGSEEPGTELQAGVHRGELAGRLRGSIVHGILQRAGPDSEGLDDLMDDLLEEEVGGIGEEDAGRSARLRRWRVREQLKLEIERLLSTDTWAEWVSEPHFRELPFVHFAGPTDWRQGRIDLFVPARAVAGEDRRGPLIVDFKTDRVEGDGVQQAAERHRIQARLYREAVDAILPMSERNPAPEDRTRVILHFTHSGQQVEL
jgi:ATP-dependent helicase/nuclease subunit A